MNFIFNILFIVILILLNLLIRNNKRRFAKVKNYIYGLMILIICLLIISFVLQNKNNLKRERYQNGGRNKKRLINCSHSIKMPKNYAGTSHCFNDNTHQTCCMLSPEIGKGGCYRGQSYYKFSVKAYVEYLKKIINVYLQKMS